MKLSYFIIFLICIITLISFSATRTINSYNKKYKSQFRVDSKSMVEASKNFYANLSKSKKNKSHGPKKLENSGWIGIGYNIANGNPIIAPQDAKLIDAGFTTSIFNQSYSNNNKTPDETYYFPDGWDVQPAKVCKTNFSSQTIKTVSKLKETMSLGLGLEGSYGAFSFSANTEYKQMSSSINNEDKIYISNTATCSLYRGVVNNYNPPEFSNNFISGLLTLKDKPFEQNEKKYYDFIKNFGTHYIHEVMMGSRYTYVLETTNTAISKMTSNGLKISAEAKYSAIVSVKAKASYSRDQEKSDEFESSITNKYVTSVGAPMPPSMEMDKWLEATVTVPMPISYLIRPITELLENPAYKSSLSKSNLDSDFLQKNLQLAIDKYCDYLIKNKIIISCEDQNINSIKKYSLSTPFDNDGNGDIHFLDRHKVECEEKSAINSFKLVLGASKYSYSYTCVKSDLITNKCVQKVTAPGVIGDDVTKSFNFLDRHNVNCDEKQALKSFKLDRSGGRDVYYSYTCCEIIQKNCSNKENAKLLWKNFDTRELAKQEVIADNNNVITGFLLKVNGNPWFNYEFRQCTLG